MAVKVKKEEKVDKQPEQMVYCGPNIPGLTQFTILIGLPNYINLQIDACESIKKLIVPIAQLNDMRLKLCVKGSYEQRLYQKVKEYSQGGNK